MFSTPSGARYTAATGQDPTVKNCQLCFSECEGVNGQNYNYNPKLLHLCSKYLHSSLTQELPNGSAVQPFCARCFGSAMELVTFSEQMEFIQRSMSDLVFMFSLEILHRRGKATDNTETTAKNPVIFDVSALPNCEAWNKPTTVFNIHAWSLQISKHIKSEDTSVENTENEAHVPDFSENHFNNVDLNSEINNEDIGNNSAMRIEEVENVDDTAAEISGKSASLKNELLTPKLQNPKLQIHGGETQIIADKGQLEEKAKPFGEDSEFLNIGRRRSVRQRSTGSSKQQWTGKLKSPPLNPTPSRSCKTAYLLRKRPRTQNVSKANRRDQRKGMSQNKKRIKPQSRMIADKKCHNGEQTHRCVFCPESFNNSVLLAYHHRQHRMKGAQLKCTYCSKVFNNTMGFVRHIRTHTGEKPFRCEKCDYAATRQSYLNEHIIRRHDDHAASNFKCRECGHKFKIHRDVKKHFKHAHFALEYSEDCVIVTK